VSSSPAKESVETNRSAEIRRRTRIFMEARIPELVSTSRPVAGQKIVDAKDAKEGTVHEGVQILLSPE
jgi:hypothetical protein